MGGRGTHQQLHEHRARVQQLQQDLSQPPLPHIIIYRTPAHHHYRREVACEYCQQLQEPRVRPVEAL